MLFVFVQAYTLFLLLRSPKVTNHHILKINVSFVYIYILPLFVHQRKNKTLIKTLHIFEIMESSYQ
jgi:hypothetical protein